MPISARPIAVLQRRWARRCRSLLTGSRLFGTLLLGILLLAAGSATAQEEPIRVKVLGGLGGVSQYTALEAPFWRDRIPQLTQGRLLAEISPFDRSGIRGQEMLQLIRLGLVSFGDVLLAVAAADEPELNAMDLPGLNPDIASLRRATALWRPRVATILRERYRAEVLAVFTYPAQVMFCNQSFTGLDDLAGRRVRTSSVAQSELIAAVGGIPVVVPFAEMVMAIRNGVVQCAITGAMSGNALGLQQVTTHVSRLAISWGVSVFAANQAAWQALPPAIRAAVGSGLAELEERVWQAAERETEEGLACNAGMPECRAGRPGQLRIVQDSWQDDQRRRQMLAEIVLPGWVDRCGSECAGNWNQFMAPSLGVRANAEP